MPSGDRVALIAFDVEAVRSSWQTVTGADLAERVRAAVWWADLDEAIAMCAGGEIEDLKTEVLLRRLKDRLGAGQT